MTTPIVSNRLPIPQVEAGVIDPVRFSLRDLDTQIDRSTVFCHIGTGPTFYRASEGVLPLEVEDVQFSLEHWVEVAARPVDAEIVGSELKVTKDQPSTAQRGLFYFGGLQAPAGPQAPLMLEFTLRAAATDMGSLPVSDNTGVVAGILNNDTGAIVTFNAGGTRRIHLLDPAFAYNSVAQIDYDWDQATAHIYKLLWHPQLDLVNLYVSSGQDDLTSDTLLISTSVSAFASTPTSEQRGNQPWAFFGHMGNAPTSIAYWSEVSFCNIVDTPLISGIPRSFFEGFFTSDNIVHYRPDDFPHKVGRGWLPLPSPFVSTPRGQISIEESELVLDRRTDTGSFGFYRQEAKLSSGITVLDFKISGDLRTIPADTQATGMGIYIDDGTKLARFALLSQDGTQYVGIANATVQLDELTSYDAALQSWGVERHYRILFSPSQVRLSNIVPSGLDGSSGFVEELLATIAYSDLPASALPPGIGFLHDVTNDPVSAVLRVSMLRYQVDLRNYEATVPPPSPWVQTGGGGSVSDDTLVIEETGEAANHYFHPEATLDSEQGSTVEVLGRVDSYEVNGETDPIRELVGVGFSIEDGTYLTQLLFAEAGPELGKIAFLSKSNDPSTDLADIRSGESIDNYVQVDWTLFHNYRLEKTKGGYLRLFIDEDELPSLEFPESEFPYPSAGTQGIYFGQLISGLNTTSSWRYVRHSVSAGFDISLKPILSENEVLSRFKHVVNVIVEAEDV